MEQLSCSLSPVFNSSRSASPWAPGTEGHCDNPSLSFGEDRERRNSMGSVVPHAHPPPPIVRRTWSRMHIAHSEVTVPSPPDSIQSRLKGTGLPSCLLESPSTEHPGQTEGGPWEDGPGSSFSSCSPPRAQAVLATPVRLAPHALPTAALHL